MADSKVVGIKENVNRDLIEILSQLLHEAETGVITGACIVTLSPTMGPSTSTYPGDHDLLSILGSVRLLEHAILNPVISDSDYEE